MNQLLFIASNFLAAAVSVLAAEVLLRGRPLWRRALAALASFPIVVLLVIQALGLAHRLTAPFATGAMLLLAVLGALAWRLRPAPQSSALPIHPSPSDGDDNDEPLKLTIATALLAGLGAAFAFEAAVLGLKYHWDDLIYHAPAAAHWLAAGQFSLTPLNYKAYYPMNTETVSLWFMLPFHADAYVSLASLYWQALAVAAVIALARLIGASRSTAFLCGAIVLACPVILAAAQTFAPVNMAGPAVLLAAVALGAPSKDDPQEFHPADCLYCGLLAGFAVGSKISFLVAAVVLGLWQVLRRPGPVGTKRITAAAVFAFGLLATGAFWYVRNWLITGNPVFPACLGPFAGPLGPREQHRTELISYLASPANWPTVADLLTAWPKGLFLLPAVAYPLAVVRLIRRQDQEPSHRSVRLVLLAVGLALLAAFPFMPFSGTIDAPNARLFPHPRYLIASFLAGIVLFSSLLRDSARSRPWFALAVLLVATSWPAADNFPVVIAAAAAGIVTLWLGKPLASFLRRGKRTHIFCALALVAILTALALTAPGKQRRNNTRLHAFKNSVISPELAESWAAVDKLPTGSRLAWFGLGDEGGYYPLFGPSLALVPVKVTPDGRIEKPLHLRWKADPKQVRWWWDQDSEGDLTGLVDHLSAAGVQYVFVGKSDHRWPRQQAVLEASHEVSRAAGNDEYTIWKLTTDH